MHDGLYIMIIDFFFPFLSLSLCVIFVLDAVYSCSFEDSRHRTSQVRLVVYTVFESRSLCPPPDSTDFDHLLWSSLN